MDIFANPSFFEHFIFTSVYKDYYDTNDLSNEECVTHTLESL